jgi:pimeloyl-ACP methyl ester carboxylesterase
MRWLIATLALIVSPAWARTAVSHMAAPHRAGDIVVEQHEVEVEGRQVPFEIGTLYVPENRRNPASRIIGVGFARIRAPKPTGAPPVFWLPGGPGQAVLQAFTDHDAAAQSRLRHWLTFGAVGDLVVVEQRGYTRRGEMLQETWDAQPLDRPATVQADIAGMRALARKAIAANPDKDLSGYDIGQFAADVDDVRKALGYDTISLWGGSFGSQWSLAVIRLYPESVARAVLGCVEPLNDGYDMPSQVYAAFQRIAYDADRDPGLAPYLPPGGLMAAIDELHERFARGPVTVEVRDDAGQTQRVVLGSGDLQLALVSHTAEAAEWPAFILSLYHGHYEQWARDTLEARQATPTTLIGPLADSSLGVTAARDHQLHTDPALRLLGTWNFESNIASAAEWPTPDVGDALREPVRTATPVVFVHGDWDTSTPIDNTLGLLPYFDNGHAIVVHRAGHDGALYQLREDPAAKQAIYDFLESGSTRALPVAAALPVPKFDVPSFVPSRPAG